MITPSHTSHTSIAERNRRNAQHSTGPCTPEGKLAARSNAVKHGLCANPASGVVEDRALFDQLHDQLIQQITPQNLIEAGLVHSIAVSLWRLQRGARVDAAIGNITARKQLSDEQRVQKWIDRIMEGFWHIECVEIRDKNKIPESLHYTFMLRGGVVRRFERSFLIDADHLREEEMTRDGAALFAMYCLIGDLVQALEDRDPFDPVEAQLLGWLLGESAADLLPPEHVLDRRALYYPDECPEVSRVALLIGQARKRPEGAPINEELLGLIQARRILLRTQSALAEDPFLDSHMQDQTTACLLPDAATLDRLIRYEAHAGRTLLRSLNTLANLRGVTLESVRCRITRGRMGQEPFGIRGQQSLWDQSELQ